MWCENVSKPNIACNSQEFIPVYRLTHSECQFTFHFWGDKVPACCDFTTLFSHCCTLWRRVDENRRLFLPDFIGSRPKKSRGKMWQVQAWPVSLLNFAMFDFEKAASFSSFSLHHQILQVRNVISPSNHFPFLSHLFSPLINCFRMYS